MADDTQLNVGVIVDVSQLASGTAQTSAAVDQMAARIKAAFGSVEKAPEGVQNALKVMQNSATQSAEIVAAAAGAMERALNSVTPAATNAGSSVDRAMSTAAARILVTEAGLGRMGLALTRVGIAAGTLGPLLTAAFPLLAVIGIISLVENLVTKFEALTQKIREDVIEEQNLAEAAQITTEKLKLEGLELEDKIDKLEKRPEHNKLEAALIQTQLRADELATSLQKDIDKSLKLFETGFWGSLLTSGSVNESDIKAQLQPFIDAVQAAKLKVAQTPAGSDAFKKAVEDEKAAYRDLASNIQQWIKVVDPQAIDTISKLESAYRTAQAAIESFSQSQANEKKRTDEASATQKHEAELIAAKQIAEFDRGAKEDARKAAEEELTIIERNIRLEKEGEEELKKFTEEKARIELELLDRRLTAEKKVMEEEKKINDDLLRSALTTAKAQMDAADSRFEHEFKMGEITEQHLLELKKKALDQEFAAEQAALQKRLGLIAANDPDNPAQRQKIYDQLLAIQQKYALQSQKINQQITEEQKQELAKMTQAFNQNFVQWVNGSETFEKAMMKTWQNMADTFITSLLKMAEQMVVNAALQKSIAAGTKLDDAKTAAANTYAQVSAIPLIGWILAPPAAAAAFAAVLAFEKGGFVPGSPGQAVPILAHAGEAVLPAGISSGLKAAFAGGTTFGGSTHYHTNHFHIDARGVASKEEIVNLVQTRFSSMLRRATRSDRELGE